MKRLISLLIALACIIGLSSSFAVAADKIDTSAGIKAVVENYISHKIEAIANLDSNNISLESPIGANEIDQFIEQETAMLKTRIKMYKDLAVDCSFCRYSISYRYDDLNINGDSATVNVFVDCDFSYSSTPNDLSAFGDRYILTLKNDQNVGWRIVDKETTDSFDNTFEQYVALYGGYDAATMAMVNDFNHAQAAEKEAQSLTQDVEYPIYETENPKYGIMATGTAKTYNRDGAAKWARDYAKKSTYSGTSFLDSSPDCTNFVSLCMREGGGCINDSDGNGASNDDKKWYYTISGSTHTKTYSWRNVNGLYTYLTTNNTSTSSNVGIYAKTVSSRSDLEKGDIVQFRSSTTSTDWTHSVIITEVVKNSSGAWIDNKVCQHSYGDSYALDCYLSTMYKDYPSDSQRRLIKIVKYFQ